MERDEYYSFKKAGAIPFKWEIRPGVPKIQDPQLQFEFEFEFPKHQNHETKKTPFRPKLKPPPNGLYFHPHSELQTLFSSSNRVGSPVLARPEVVSSSGCTPLKKRQNAKKRTGEPRSRSQPEYYSDHDTSSRWSVSSRNSISPLSSPFASYRSSPRPATDSDWAAFGLF
ncbi:hypothetical protein ABFS82_03G096200 [Erythranthe guttata]|uniref:Uncharacterized protein n=1 Tax=Erythranthe guttata TaxID=4155 RepID=A0A022QV09_ERYGU|nr:PREDICTED: uncharacterized protein LOC105963452 [Erythranthe guttata]EYU32512.1 hypothetical protein MIMGU_mgv1a021487mg [Erythranthe guttata]|eukprot:XP_012843310.1 PREDICTED: uncharacterized protein LOC105963452 [Erythranthe guttata]